MSWILIVGLVLGNFLLCPLNKKFSVDVFDFWPKWLAFVILIPPMAIIGFLMAIVLCILILVIRLVVLIYCEFTNAKDPFD